MVSLKSEGLSRAFSRYHNFKESILSCSAFVMAQLSQLYMTSGKKTLALIRQTFVDKMISLLFNALSRFVTAFLPRSKYLLISWLQSPFAVILEFKKIKSVTVSTVSQSLPQSDGTRCHDFSFLNVKF